MVRQSREGEPCDRLRRTSPRGDAEHAFRLGSARNAEAESIIGNPVLLPMALIPKINSVIHWNKPKYRNRAKYVILGRYIAHIAQPWVREPKSIFKIILS